LDDERNADLFVIPAKAAIQVFQKYGFPPSRE